MADVERWNRPETAVHAPLSPEEARQGVISGRVGSVLAASLTLALVAFAIIYAVYV